MKKFIITTALSLAVTGAAFAQGAVNWGSISFTSVTAQTNSTQYSPLFGGGTTGGGAIGNAGGSYAGGAAFYYELLVGSVWSGAAQAAPATVSALASWTDSTLGATNSNTAGRLTVMGANAGATVNALSSTESNSIILVGWSANLGTTWSAALASLNNPKNIVGTGFFGETGVGVLEAAALPTSVGNNVFGSAAQSYGIPIYSLNTQLYEIQAGAVPEPGTLALAALGGASLLMFRRKK